MLSYFIALFCCCILSTSLNILLNKKIQIIKKKIKENDGKFVFFSLSAYAIAFIMILYPMQIVKSYENSLYMQMFLRILIGNIMCAYCFTFIELENKY